MEVSISWMLTISYSIGVFYILLFLTNIRIYLIIFSVIVIFGGPTWIVIYFLETFVPGYNFPSLTVLRHLSAIISFSVLSPGLTLAVINYIKNNTNSDKPRRVFHKYHIHEGFVGIVFILISLILMVLRYNLVKYEIFRTDLRIFLAINMIILYLFLFFGSFLVFRDWRDVIKGKFIQKRDFTDTDPNPLGVNTITADSITFFKPPKFLLYPFGLLFSSIAVNIFIHGTDFLPEEVFTMNHETLVLLGIIFSFISGGIVGLDWYRLFAKIYPETYQKFEILLDKFRINDSEKI
jgi:hypothetical protein